MRPMKPIVLALPLGLGLGVGEVVDVDAVRDDDRVAARCSTSVRRAYSLTAIRALIFSSAGWRIGYAAIIARERGFEVWKVATIGPCAAQQASRPREGEAGSWMCRTSNSPSCSQRRTRAADRKPKFSRATEPLYGTGTARPAETTYGGSGVSSSAGARTDTSWPSRMKYSARSRMWNWTPPGHVPGVRADDADPHERPRPSGGVEIREPQALQHVPVLRVVGDAGGEGVGQRLCHDRRLLGPGPCSGHLDRRMDPALHDRRVVVPERHGQQQRARLLGEQGRSGRHPGRLAEELHLDAGGGQVAVGDQADQAAVAQPPGERAEGGAAAVRQDLHAEALAVGDEPVVERLRLEAFGDRGERRLQLGGDPRAGEVPVGHVRQREDDAAAGGEAVGQVVHVLGLEAGLDALARSRRAAGRTPSSSAGTTACPRARARRAARDSRRAPRARSWLSSRRTPLPRRFQARSAMVPAQAHGDRLGELLDGTPAEAVERVGQPLLGTAHGVAPLLRALRVSAGRRGVGLRGLPADGDDPLDQRDEAADGDDPQRDRQQALDARDAERVQPGETAATSEIDQPLGALDQAVDGDRQADRLAARLGVRHHLAAGQAEDRDGAQERCCRRRPRTRGRSRRRSRCRRPGRGWSPGRRPSGWSGPAGGPCCRRRGRRTRTA